MKMVLVFLMLFQCHQKSGKFNIVLGLLNTIFKHNLKKLLNSVQKLLQSCKRGTKTFWAILSFVVGVPKLFKRFWGTKNLCQMLPGLKKFFHSSKIPSALVPTIKNDYSLILYGMRYKCSHFKILNSSLACEIDYL